MFKNSNFDEHQYEQYDGIRDIIVNEIPVGKYNNILEIGCGCGHMTKELACKFPEAKVLGVDIVNDYINTAKKTYSNYRNLDFRCVNYQNLETKFDIIVLFNAFTELLKKETITKILNHFNEICQQNALIVLAEEFADDYIKEFALTKSINELIGYKYLNKKSTLKSFKNYELIKNELYNLEGQKLNIEGVAHYISYECMLNNEDNTFKLKPIEIWNKKKNKILKQGYIKINSKIRMCILRRK